ncbi:kinesin-like protein KIF27 [Elysia marginata]|uniref:Kinesin-like protein KIF27 n=1 Tax=Elysia marginata TaxID=1093978 RepID=A0AAV4JB40_9GAST|nr:kinesin-like protein KIF27 [Elysia marginata]
MSSSSTQEVNVKVAVRVRPLLTKEKLSGEQLCVRTGSSSNQLVLGSDRSFTFDHTFFSSVQQEEVYKRCVEPLVHTLFDGYNATVFAYGQTGSGKTYTIGGGDITSLTEEEYGIIPRALTDMFRVMEENKSKQFTVNVSYIEIYMEELRDLLALDAPSRDLHVREDSKGNTVIVGAREIECESLDEVMSYLESGSAARHTGSTQMNEQSSRSHSIFTVVIGQRWSEADSAKEKRLQHANEVIMDPNVDDQNISHYMSGKFHFVDLAGSERAHKTGNIGDRFKESIYINSGLLSLGNVISALGDTKKKASHIPYRESKITRLLKDSLGGNAQTLMICCISPASSNFDESLNSLKYANRAKNIKNKPIINRDIQLQTECSHYRMVAEEAYKHITDIQGKDVLSRSQELRLKDWLELLEEIKNQVPMTLSRDALQNETIKSLQQELQECKSHLESDETIFADKKREVDQLNETIKDMENTSSQFEWQLQDISLKCQQQEEQLLAQQMRIEELEAALKLATVNDSSIDETASLPSSLARLGGMTGRRPKSVPAHVNRNKEDQLLRPPSRMIKTSPALFTLERVMQSFRARSQLLVSRLEDGDDVLHQMFSDDDDDEEDNDNNVNADGVNNVDKMDTSSNRAVEKNRKNTRVGRRDTFHVKRPTTQDSDAARMSTRASGDMGGPGAVRSSTHLLEEATALVVRASMESSGSRLINMDVESSAELNRKLIKQSKLKALEAHQKIRDLSINIRMKEQLIKELVKSEKDAELMNKQYADKIKGLEKEKESAKQELSEVQRALQQLEARDKSEISNKAKLEMDFKKKIEDAKAKVAALQKKQKETEKVASFAQQHEKKIGDLELAIERMKQQQETLQKKLKDESDQKVKLEREMVREVQRVKELEIRDEQNQKVLKRKTEELASAKRRLRSASGVLPPISSEEQSKLEEQRKWVDGELEKVIEQRRQNEDLEQELRKREEIVAKKEAMLAEQSELQMKRMRSSQALNKSLVSVSSKMDSVERRLEEKRRELPEAGEEGRARAKEEIIKLKHMRDKLGRQRTEIEDTLRTGSVLAPEEERRLIETDEAIEALDAAIQFKDESIHAKQMEVRMSMQALQQSEENLVQRLNTLSPQETRALLSRYFDKVVSLREAQGKLQLQCSEMVVKTDEQERLIIELKGAVQRAAIELDRRLTQQQRDHQKETQVLFHQLAQQGNEAGDMDRNQDLQKDLFYYRKKFRDQRQKIQDMVSAGQISSQFAEEAGLIRMSVQSVDGEVMTPRAPPPGQNHNSHHHHHHHHHHSSRPGSSRNLQQHQQYPFNNNSNNNNNGIDPSQYRESRSSVEPTQSHRSSLSRMSGGHHQKSVTDQAPLSACSSHQKSTDHMSGSVRSSGHHKSGSDQPGAATPVKISRKDLRQMSTEEILVRRSNISSRSSTNRTPHDSLEDP